MSVKRILDKAIRSLDDNIKLKKTIKEKNGYGLYVVETDHGERIVLTFKGENYTNPHMWLGSPTSANMQNALQIFSRFENIKS